MIASAQERAPGTGGLAPAFAAARTRLGLIALLFALAALGWWWTVDEMQGMDGGPWTDLGTFAWFVGVWVVMMAAMMFPSVAPTVALYSSMTKRRSPVAPLLFTSGYLIAWTSVGVLAFAVATAGGLISGDLLAWDRAGRWVAGATLIVAAVYELTPLKDVCLGKCRSPLGFLLGSWRSGRSGALQMGARHGAWCIGCCWALMASLFALGVMSILWMAVVAGLIAFEKLIPSRRTATYVTAAILLVLGVLLIAAPDTIPGLTVPGGLDASDGPDEPVDGAGVLLLQTGFIDHIGIGVPDLAAAKEYYEGLMSVLGLREWFETGPEGPLNYGPDGALGSQLFFYQAEPGTYSRGQPGLHHLAFLVASRAVVREAHRVGARTWRHDPRRAAGVPPVRRALLRDLLARSPWVQAGSGLPHSRRDLRSVATGSRPRRPPAAELASSEVAVRRGRRSSPRNARPTGAMITLVSCAA